MDAGQVIQTVLYVIPGFIATGIMFFRVPTRKRSDFERLTISVIFSIPIYGLGLLLDKLTPVSFTSNTALYFAFSVPCAILAGYLVSGIMKAVWFPDVVQKILKVDFDLAPGVWNLIFDVRKRERIDAWDGWVKVYTMDGATYLGYASHYTIEPDVPEKELFLSRAYRLQMDAAGNVMQEIPIDHGVFLPSQAITRVEFLRGQDAPQDSN